MTYLYLVGYEGLAMDSDNPCIGMMEIYTDSQITSSAEDKALVKQYLEAHQPVRNVSKINCQLV